MVKRSVAYNEYISRDFREVVPQTVEEAARSKALRAHGAKMRKFKKSGKIEVVKRLILKLLKLGIRKSMELRNQLLRLRNKILLRKN